MKFSIITCSYENLEGVKATVTALRSPAVSLAVGAPARRTPKRPGSYRQDCRSTGIDIEHIIIDGGSTDGTVDALRAWEKEEGIKDNGYELKWISEPDRGLYDALNKGLRMATGDVIGILHTDDVWEPGVLARVADVFRREASLECACPSRRSETARGREPASCRFGGEACPKDVPAAREAELRGGKPDFTERMLRTPESGTSQAQDPWPSPSDGLGRRTPGASIDAVYGDLLYVDADNISKVRRVWKSGCYDPKKWFNGWMPPHPALFVTRELAQRVGEYRLDLGSAADYEWMLRAGLVHGARFVHLPETLVRMRVGGQSNVSVQGRLKAHGADRRAWEVNGLKPRPWTLKMKVVRKFPQWVRAWRIGGASPP